MQISLLHDRRRLYNILNLCGGFNRRPGLNVRPEMFTSRRHVDERSRYVRRTDVTGACLISVTEVLLGSVMGRAHRVYEARLASERGRQ
jgi:hypothetical protein